MGYAGVAVVNLLWRLFFGHDSPELLAVLGGFLYGLSFGPLLQCLVLGAVAHFAWELGLRRLFPWLITAPWPAKLILWIGAEAAYVLSSAWALLALVAYSLPALLSWLFNFGG